MRFSKQEYWRGLPFPSPGNLPNPRIECRSPAMQADSLPFELTELRKTKIYLYQQLEYWGGLPCPPWGDLPNLGIKPRSPALQADSLPSEPPVFLGSPRILEWVAYPFFRGSSQPRNQTRVSCIACRFFNSWATMKKIAVPEHCYF